MGGGGGGGGVVIGILRYGLYEGRSLHLQKEISNDIHSKSFVGQVTSIVNLSRAKQQL